MPIKRSKSKLCLREAADHTEHGHPKLMTDEAPEKRDWQRRVEERSERDIEAKVELGDRLVITCRVKDLSQTGFKIQIVEAIHLPDQFDLLIPVIGGIFQRYRVRMVWRKADMVGGEFVPPLAD